MRARNIKPGTFKNEILGTADPLLTILFAGLWCLADKEGRLEDRPLRIKAEIFPYRESLDINRYLTELCRHRFIQRYSVDGSALIQVLNFAKHQNPHHTEKKSVLPAPINNGELTDIIRDTPSDSLIPDSLIPDSPPAPKAALFELPDWISEEAWAGFEEMRKKIKKPMTDRARNLAVSELEKLRQQGQNPDAVLNQSVLNSWQSLYALKGVPTPAVKSEHFETLPERLARKESERAARA